MFVLIIHQKLNNDLIYRCILLIILIYNYPIKQLPISIIFMGTSTTQKTKFIIIMQWREIFHLISNFCNFVIIMNAPKRWKLHIWCKKHIYMQWHDNVLMWFSSKNAVNLLITTLKVKWIFLKHKLVLFQSTTKTSKKYSQHLIHNINCFSNVDKTTCYLLPYEIFHFHISLVTAHTLTSSLHTQASIVPL